MHVTTCYVVAADPATFVDGPETVCIDEYQHVPLVLDAIQAELNRDGRPGRFVLTGLDGVAGVGQRRTRDGDEVDLVLERDDGGVVAFGVKASQRVDTRELAPLRKLRDALGAAFIAGVALHLGEQSYRSEDRLHVLPVDRLWCR